MCHLFKGRCPVVAPFNGLVQIFGIQTDSEFSIGLSRIRQAIHPVRRFGDLTDDALVLHLVQFLTEFVLDMDGTLMYDGLYRLVENNMVLAFEVADLVELVWIRSGEIICRRDWRESLWRALDLLLVDIAV